MEYILNILMSCMGITVFVPQTLLRFWDFWKPIEDRKFSWHSFPNTTLIHLSRELLWIQGRPVYKHTLNFQVSVLMPLTTSEAFFSPYPQLRLQKSNPSAKPAESPLFPESFPKSFRRYWSPSLLWPSLHSSSSGNHTQAPPWTLCCLIATEY